jgi:two-component system sensor histidine kinase AlgZ
VQPLVENAIKHGIATMAEGGEISMQARSTGDAIRFEIENPFDEEAPLPRNQGIGLRNVQQRLRAKYGNSASISIEAGSGRYRVLVTIPCTRLGDQA